MNNQSVGRAPVIPARVPNTFWGPDLVSTRDLGPSGVEAVLHLAGIMKMRPADFRGALAGKQMVMFFEKPSLRTRLTFEAGMSSLGGATFFVDQTHERLDGREKLSDIAHNLERWVDAIVLRTFAQETIAGMAEHASVPVINALSDLEHPCQALADYFTLQERFGNLKNICLAYVGDAVYTDAWASMGQEHEAGKRARIFPPYQMNDELVAGAAPHAVFMHCLPAHRGEEITDAVMDSERSVVFDQAESRLHVQKAILYLLLGGETRQPARSAHA